MSGLIIRPGDVLILGVPSKLTEASARAIKAHLMGKMPGLADVALVGESAGVIAVYRKPAAPRPPVPAERLP